MAHGRILRTDALLSELMLVAVLAALAFWSGRTGWWSLAVCALATGLAWLTKTPALALLGAVPAAAVAGVFTRGALTPQPPLPVRGGGGGLAELCMKLVVGLMAWLAGSVLVVLAVWPAMWVRPLRAVERMAVYTQEKGGSPMDAGGFFLGLPVADPGPLYYAVALPLRLSPLVLIGLALWLGLRAPGLRRGVGITLLIGLGLAVVLAFLPKKADRYILPAIPFLIVVAAVGIAELATRWRQLKPAGAAGLVLAGEVALLTLAWPYPLAAYNPVLGGAPAATAAISVGWGEGLDQVAPVLNARPDGDFLTVSTPYPEVLQAQINGRAVDLDAFDIAEYAVRYVAADQRRLGSPALDTVLASREPLERVEIAGVPYAELYELDPPSFAGNIQTRGIEVTPNVVGRRGTVTIKLALGPPSAEGRRRASAGLTPFVTPLDVEAVLLNSANPNDVEATVTRSLLPGRLARRAKDPRPEQSRKIYRRAEHSECGWWAAVRRDHLAGRCAEAAGPAGVPVIERAGAVTFGSAATDTAGALPGEILPPLLRTARLLPAPTGPRDGADWLESVDHARDRDGVGAPLQIPLSIGWPQMDSWLVLGLAAGQQVEQLDKDRERHRAVHHSLRDREVEGLADERHTDQDQECERQHLDGRVLVHELADWLRRYQHDTHCNNHRNVHDG